MTGDFESTPAVLRRLAKAQPGRQAVIEDGTAYTYSRFALDLDRVHAAIGGWDLGPGAIAAVEWRGLYRHWLLLLALSERGVTTASYLPIEQGKNREILADADAVIAAPDGAPDGIRRLVPVDGNWWKETLSKKRPARFDAVVSDPSMRVRLVQSSGTTGMRKRMLRTHANELFRMDLHRDCLGLDPSSRFLVCMSFAMQGIYLGAQAALRQGASIVYRSGPEPWRAFRERRPSHATMLPIKLEAMLDQMPEPAPRNGFLKILMQGGTVTPALRKKAQEMIGADLIETYATNEAGMIGILDEDGSGTLLPGIEMMLVDGDGKPVAQGAGLVRVRTPGLVASFHRDEKTSERLFRDGWFQPGDLAEIPAPGRFRLIGRADDLQNYRGVKFLPEHFEHALRERLEVADLCVTVQHGCDPGFWVLFAPKAGGADGRQVAEVTCQVLPKPLGRIGILPVRSLPRTETGKLCRQEIAGTLGRKLAAEDARKDDG